jgi:6-methylsalicylate decarboxylase
VTDNADASTNRIDVHHHAIVPKIAALMRERNAPFVLPWSLGETWDVMGANGVQYALVSNPVPGGFLGDAGPAAAFITAANEAVAELVHDHPDRFGLLAALPMPYVDAALEQIRYAYDVLGADGVVLIPQSGGRYLGDPLYDDVFAELDRRRAVALVHPLMLPGGPIENPPSVLADFLLDTVRGAVNLMLTSTLDRYPNISFILSHAGGFLPYAASRVRVLADRFYGLEPERFAGYLARFYYDVALSAPSALPSLLAAVPESQILFGTDWCAASAGPVTECTRGFDEAGYLDQPARRMVNRDNALRLLPRLAQRLSEGAALSSRR